MAYRTEITAPPGTGQASSICIPLAGQHWPVAGWSLFEFLQSPESNATRHDSGLSTILGLGYSIHYCRACANDSACGANGPRRDGVLLRIDSWHYDLSGASTDLPVMEILFDPDLLAVPAKSVMAIKIMARALTVTEKTSSRAVNAALFFLHQIQAGQVPDFERILELHRLHPDLRPNLRAPLNGDANLNNGAYKNNKGKKPVVPTRRLKLGPYLKQEKPLDCKKSDQGSVKGGRVIGSGFGCVFDADTGHNDSNKNINRDSVSIWGTSQDQ